mgnify:CR=1 FL=1
MHNIKSKTMNIKGTVFIVGFALFSLTVASQSNPLSDIFIRDPYILADAENNCYYLYRTSTSVDAQGTKTGGVEVFKSDDLQNWRGPTKVFAIPENNWITGVVWAPEVHAYNGKYYLFATINSDLTWKIQKENWPAYTFRGTQIFYSDSPEGPFIPFDLKPHTPMDYMALDGTFWKEDGKPYMIFCREWVEVIDGTVELQELTSDLSSSIGRPMRLFCASDAPWVTSHTHYITDGCFLFRTKMNKLLMIWSSFGQNGYAIGIAKSVTGKVSGPWKQSPEPLLNENGGHGMIFRTFDDKLCLILHQPNHPAGSERARIFELEDTGDTLLVKGEI